MTGDQEEKRELPKVTDLTDAQLNLIIGEWMGILRHQDGWWQKVGMDETWNYISKNPLSEPGIVEAMHRWGLPRYTESLDAMAKAEKTLPFNLRQQYCDELGAILSFEPSDWWFIFITVTAKQRAQAIAVTLGKAVL